MVFLQLQDARPCKDHQGDWLVGGFKSFLFSPLPGEDSHFDEHIFSKGLKPPTSHQGDLGWLLFVAISVGQRGN